MTTLEKLQSARDRIAEKGRTRFTFCGANGQRCLYAALEPEWNSDDWRGPEQNEAHRLVAQHIDPTHVRSPEDWICSYNNRPITDNEVLNMLDDVIAEQSALAA